MARKKAEVADNNHKPEPRKGLSTNIFITHDIQRRLSRYLLERFEGRMHMRNSVIMEALNEKLTKEGF